MFCALKPVCCLRQLLRQAGIVEDRRARRSAGIAGRLRLIGKRAAALLLFVLLLLRGVLEPGALRRHVHHALLLCAGLTDRAKARVIGLAGIVHHRVGVGLQP